MGIKSLVASGIWAVAVVSIGFLFDDKTIFVVDATKINILRIGIRLQKEILV